MIGLEYVIEVNLGLSFECFYHCVLCDERFDFSSVTSHLIAHKHRSKYLVS